MNKVLMSLAFGVFILTGPSFAQTPPPAPAAAAPTTTTTTTTTTTPDAIKPVHHHHSDIHKAMHKLRGAKDELQKLTNDYGGHRTQAIADIDLALTELKAAIDADAATTKQ